MSESPPPETEEQQEPSPPGALTDYVRALLTSRSHVGPTLKAAASALSPANLTPAGLAELRDVDHQAAVEAVRLRAEATLAYWGPLLPSCKDGFSSSPLSDLTGLLHEVRALIAGAAGEDQASLTELANQLEGWFPQKSSGSLTAAKFEAPVVSRAAPSSRKQKAVTRPVKSTRFEKPMLLLLALLIVGVLVARVANRPPPAASVQAYRGAVAEVLEVGIRGDTLVVVVESSWAKKAESKRLQDVDSIEGTVAGEPINRIVVEDRTRARLAELNENGTSLFSP